MRGRPLALVLATLLALPALAGCADKGEAARQEPLQRGDSTQPSAPRADPATPTPAAPKPKGTSERWHFHDYWGGSPVITLFDGTVTLNATAPPQDPLGPVSHVLALPPGVIVPAETGLLTFNATWETPGGEVRLAYRPADANEFFPAGPLREGEPLAVETTESMCDVPHRQESLWRFNFTGYPTTPADGAEAGVPPREVRIVITAAIGRPLFIDPPHLDWWQGGSVLALVEGTRGEAATAASPAGNATLPPAATVPQKTPGELRDETTQPVRVPVDEGMIVPEGAKSVVVALSWTSTAPGGKPSVRWRESNFPSEGAMPVVKDGDGTRLFAMEVRPAQTDTTYSNRTTWEFLVVPEGEAGAFQGSFELKAWATRLAPDEAGALIKPA